MNARKAVLVFSALVVGIFALTNSVAAQTTTRIAGPNTLIFLGQQLTQQYQQKHPGQFAVGGPLKADEAEIVQSEGSVATSHRAAFPVAVQAIVVYVNSSNPLRELTVAQLRRIFLGEITNWKELGGRDLAIHLYGGESTSGTLPFFQDMVLRGEEPYPFVGKSNTRGLLEVVASDQAGIGYASLDESPGTRAVAIKAGPASVALAPTIPSIRSLEYPLARHIYWMISSSTSPSTREFCAWALSAEGQLVAEASGFQPLLPNERSAGLTRLGLKDAPTSVATGR